MAASLQLLTFDRAIQKLLELLRKDDVAVENDDLSHDEANDEAGHNCRGVQREKGPQCSHITTSDAILPTLARMQRAWDIQSGDRSCPGSFKMISGLSKYS